MGKRKKRRTPSAAIERDTTFKPIVLYVVYYLVLAAMLLASFFPEQRIWGFNHWAYYPSYVAIVLFCLGALLPVAVRLLSRFAPVPADRSSSETGDSRRFTLVFIAVAAVLAAGFYFLPADTHFLGDGYTLLSNLASDNTIIKERNLGVMLVLKQVYNLLGGEPQQRALLAHQIVSYTGGILFLVVVFFLARILFATIRDRILFSLGLLSSGYMLLFFGYVENYSLLIPAIGLFILTGLQVTLGKVRRWYILLPLLPVIFLHIFGIVLIPAALYILLYNTPLALAWGRLSVKTRILIGLAAILAIDVVFYYLFTNYYFFRFAFVPPLENQFTIEGYTLSSPAHLIDIVNLCYLLLPALPLLIVVAFFIPLTRIFSRPDTFFLLVLTLSALVTVVMLDPKVGMPRDWDLFAFCGVPMAVVGYIMLFHSRLSPRIYGGVAVLAIFLGWAVLIPRAVGRAAGEVERYHVENYMKLDTKKNMNLFQILQDHYLVRGDSSRAVDVFYSYEENFPERKMNKQGLDLCQKGQYAESIPYFQSALRENPMMTPAYSNLGFSLLVLGRFDQARDALEIAHGLNPHSPKNIFRLGYLHQKLGELGKAEQYYQRARSLAPQDIPTLLALTDLYRKTEQTEKYVPLLVELTSYREAPPLVHKWLGDYYHSSGTLDLADDQYRQAVDKGMDSTLARPPIE
ncbi:MAG: tetratricopeptide repeat protein [Candidatus Zixiibacteriota bacterium]|nr:MAG: tetratricopeptide repeat protein [candidate division Zixibacteria bacterium]